MKTVPALLAVAALLALAAPAAARPIDAYGPIPSDAPRGAPAAARSIDAYGPIPSDAPRGAPAAASSGTETWVVVAAAVLAFAAGAAAGRLAPTAKVRPS